MKALSNGEFLATSSLIVLNPFAHGRFVRLELSILHAEQFNGNELIRKPGAEHVLDRLVLDFGVERFRGYMVFGILLEGSIPFETFWLLALLWVVNS